MHFVNREVSGMQKPARTSSPASAADAIAANTSTAKAKLRNMLLQSGSLMGAQLEIEGDIELFKA
jgi:hypothetical protein